MRSYRFWGSIDPRGRVEQGLKPSVLAYRPDDDAPLVVDGVATLRLYDPVDSWGEDWGVSAREFGDALAAVPDAREIRLHVNSPGGEVFDAIAILNQLRAHPARVVAVVDGVAASAASFIAAGADEMVMRPNTQLMIHDAWGLCVGDAADMRDTAAQLDRFSDNIASIYAAKAGGDVADWRARMRVETWFDPAEAEAAGLADTVEDAAPDTAQIAAEFDLSMFRARHEQRAAAAAAASWAQRHARNRHSAMRPGA